MKHRRSRLLKASLLAAVVGVGTAFGQAALVAAIDSTLPDASHIDQFNRPGTLTILADDGQVIQTVGPATREKITSGQMPPLVERAFIAAEDRRFYEHDGIDLQGIARALVRNITQGSVEDGASTITQQLARTVFLSQDRTLVRKLREAALAGKIERQLTKRQILEQYLNVVYLGSSAYGVADAAWIYFSKTPDQLSLSEAALIAGLPPAPSIYSPLVHPELALQRRSIVLRRMEEMGAIDGQQRAAADAEPLRLKPSLPKYWTSRAPYFTNWVTQELPRVLSPEQLEVGGLTIRTGLNLRWQEDGQAVIRQHTGGALEGALVTMEPGTGLVRAMVGGKDFETSQFNRATQALRSPGSTFKLFVYLTALKEGILPDDAIVDAPRCFAGYCPRNFGNRYMGSVALFTALQNSLNTVSVSLLQRFGFDKVIATARSLGLKREMGHFYPLAVGAYEQTILDMTAAYAAINNRGIYVSPTPFIEIHGPNGERLWSRRVDGDKGRRAVDSDIADTMLWMLQQVVQGGTGGGAALSDRPVAGKTGTSEGGRDLWFIGSIPQLTTGLWLGYDNNLPTNSTSVLATFAWHDYMAKVVRDLPVRPFPPRPRLQRRQVNQGTRSHSEANRQEAIAAPPSETSGATSAYDPAPQTAGPPSTGGSPTTGGLTTAPLPASGTSGATATPAGQSSRTPSTTAPNPVPPPISAPPPPAPVPASGQR
ncbi:MAG: PBP1A family penicillin-binding protein [Cyanobacteriota bacterium]